MPWAILDYVDGRSEPISDWMKDLPVRAKAKIDDRQLMMRQLDRWPDKWVSKYQGTNLYEFRIPFHKIQYRPLGVYDGEKRFVLLAGATERDGRLVPASVLAVAEKRRQELRKDGQHARAHDFG